MLAPVELYEDLLTLVNDALSKGAESLIQYARDKPWIATNKASLSREDEDEDRKVLETIGHVYFAVFAPFILRALSEGVYGKASDLTEDASRLAEIRKEWQGLLPFS